MNIAKAHLRSDSATQVYNGLSRLNFGKTAIWQLICAWWPWLCQTGNGIGWWQAELTNAQPQKTSLTGLSVHQAFNPVNLSLINLDAMYRVAGNSIFKR